MDLIERQAAIDTLDDGAEYLRRVLDVTDLVGVERTKYEWGLGLIEACIADVKELQTVQPEEIALHESCTDCPMYDKDKHSCPRFNKVIPEALREVQSEQRWIPVSERLPEDYVDVLVWFEYFRYGNYNSMYATHGIGNYSSEFGSWMINHESGWQKLRVFAWMPLPEPCQKGAIK